MSDSTAVPTAALSTSSSLSSLLVDPIPTPTSEVLPPVSELVLASPSVAYDEDKDDEHSDADSGEGKEEKKKKVNRLAVDRIKDFVVLPLDLVKVFNINELWGGQGEESVLIKTSAVDADGVNQLVPTWMIDASMADIIHGADDMREDLARWGDKSKGLMRAISMNRTYHLQLKAMMAEQGITELPPLTGSAVIPDDDDESGGLVPQLRWNMIFTVPIQDEVDGEGMEQSAIDAGKATLIALNDVDANKWIRDNVVGLKKGKYTALHNLVGELPDNYANMPVTEFAAWLDVAFVKKAEENAKAKLEREAKKNNKRRYEGLSEDQIDDLKEAEAERDKKFMDELAAAKRPKL